MGRELICEAHHDEASGQAKVELTSWDLRFRGPFRLVVPLDDVTGATHHEGVVTVRFDAGEVRFAPGKTAPRWVDGILNPPSRLDKLDIAAGQRVSVIGLDDAKFADELSGRVSEVAWGSAVPDSDRILFVAHAREELDGVGEIAPHIKRDGALWVLWPKGRKAIKRSDVFAALHAIGLVDVKVASFSATYSALKFMIRRRDR